MNSRVVMIVVSAIVLSVAVFYGGYSWGKKNMGDYCGHVIQWANAGDHASTFARHMSALNALRDGNLPEVEKTIRLLAHVDAQAITNCEKDPYCSKLSDAPVADHSFLQQALSWK